MADSVDVRSQDAVAQSRGSLLVPAVVATSLGLLMLLVGAGQWLLAELLLHTGQLGLFPGDNYIPSSAAEKVVIVFQHLWPVVVGVGLLFLTWRLRGQARAGATWIAAVAAVVVCAAALPW